MIDEVHFSQILSKKITINQKLRRLKMYPLIDSKLLKYYNQFPIVGIDIGASGGLNKFWEPVEKHIHAIGFEPDKREFEYLAKSQKKKSVEYLNVALYKEKKEIDFYLTKKQQCSSIFKPNQKLLNSFNNAERFEVIKTVKINADALDNQLIKNGIKDVDMIKIDTQGSELSILQGSEKILRNSVFGLQIEVEFSEIYRNQPLFSDVDNFLRKLGFQLFDLYPCYLERKAGKRCREIKGQMVFADAIYLKNLEKFETILEGIQDDDFLKTKILKSLSVCILYKHYDYALEIINRNKNLFSKEEIKTIIKRLEGKETISNILGRIIPNIPGRGKISNIFWMMFKIFQPNFWKAIVYLEDGQRIEKY
jgi:FkbM family methyltransferase